MRGSKTAIALVVLTAALWFHPARAQPIDVDRELEEAKALYREAKFAQAIARLERVVGRLEQIRDLQARKIQLSDAHLHLALSYVALNDPTAAKASLKQMLRADRNRSLDPDIYAPKVMELFEQARAEVAGEPKPVASAPTVTPASTGAKKGGSKAPLIVLGLGAAAAGGLAVAKGGGGGSPSPNAAAGRDSGPSGTTPSPSGANDVVLVNADPPAGSTISLASRSSATFMFQVNLGGSGRGWLFIKIADRAQFSGGTSGCENSAFTAGFNAGTNVSVTHGLDLSPLMSRCSLPVDLEQLEVNLLREGTTDSANTLDANMFTINYRVVR